MMILSQDGTAVSSKDLAKEQKSCLNDYKLIQYDISAGEGYLYDTKFFE